MRFVVVGTMLRGELENPEPLDEQGQVLARYQLDMDRAAPLSHARVIWNGRVDPARPKRERMSETAATLAGARRLRA